MHACRSTLEDPTDPVLNNWTVCENLGQVDISSRLVLAANSPVIEHVDVFRADFNVLQIAAGSVTEVKSEFVFAGYMKMIELAGTDFFSYDTVPYTKLAIELKYEDGLPQFPIWDFKPEVMQFDAPFGEARDGSIVARAPIGVKGIAESVSTFSAADVGVLPMPGIIPGSAAFIPYPSNDASPADYLIGYRFSVAPPWTGDSAGGRRERARESAAIPVPQLHHRAGRSRFMTDQMIGEVRLHAGPEAPVGWADCNGQQLAIADHLALFSVIGTTCGGDGITTFAVPDLRGRIAVHAGYRPGLTARRLGEQGGSATTTLDESQLSVHTHAIAIPNAPGDRTSPSEGVALAGAAGAFGTPDSGTALSASSLAAVGGNQPHNNLQPYIALRYIIALSGVVPEPA